MNADVILNNTRLRHSRMVNGCVRVNRFTRLTKKICITANTQERIIYVL